MPRFRRTYGFGSLLQTEMLGPQPGCVFVCKLKRSAISLVVFMELMGCGSSSDPSKQESSGSGAGGAAEGSGGGTGATASGGSSPSGGAGAAASGGSNTTGGTTAGGGTGGSNPTGGVGGDTTGGSSGDVTGGNGGDPTGGAGGNPAGGVGADPTGGRGGGSIGGRGGGSTGGNGGSPTGGGSSDPTGGGSGDPTGGAGGGPSGGSSGDPTGGAGGDPSGGSGGGGPDEVGPTGTETIPGDGCTPPAAYANLFVAVSGHTQEETDAKVNAAWNQLYNPSNANTVYYNGPGSDESYVKDTGNNDVRTEGMSYGMMTALQLDKQTEFDRLWSWVKNHMAQGTGQIAWQCSTSGGKMSSGGAPDGEEYMATALIFAHSRWGDASGKFDYAAEAQWVLDLIRKTYFNSTYHIVQFVANSGNTDASYILPAFYQVWACFDTANASFWEESVTAARSFFHAAADSNGVIGDRQSFTGQTQQGAGSDAKRCVMNIMMDHNFFAADPWQTETYAPAFGSYMKSHSDGSAAQFSCNALLGFGLPESSGKSFVDKLWSASIPTGTWRYYDGTLYMLSLLHVSGTFKLYY